MLSEYFYVVAELFVVVPAAGDTRSVVETDGHHAINPSIGPSIGEMSVGMTNSLSASGSHLERVGVIREDCCSDRDSASHQAMAGSCINASLSGSLLAGPTGFHNRSVQLEPSLPLFDCRDDDDDDDDHDDHGNF